ncbi:hypothetical protein ACJRO7_002693 [Eucalyptus globulus]|uniref:Uncharacterized protein n=1 Tax=Eucalyptus globulus TaxID=34317 RepID=A0ABD3LWB4_EUCGL
MGMRGIMNKKVENGERCGEKASPYVQMVPSKRHQRVILRMFAIFKKNPGMKLLGVEVGKSNGNDVDIGAEKRCTGSIPQSTIRAKVVAWVLMKLQVSNPFKEEEERNEEDDSNDNDDILTYEEEECEEVELCKSRILMGRRCKRLYGSSTLQYNNDGILLPKSLP